MIPSMLQLSPAKTVRSKLRLRRQRYATDCVPPDMVTTNADHLGRPYFLVSYGLDGLPPPNLLISEARAQSTA